MIETRNNRLITLDIPKYYPIFYDLPSIVAHCYMFLRHASARFGDSLWTELKVYNTDSRP